MNRKEKILTVSSSILCIIFIITRSFLAPIVAGDEFINFYNTLKIFNGAKMWQEVNIITTPLLYLIGCIFFKILGVKFIIYRIYNILINLAFFGIIYQTFKNLKLDKKTSIIYSIILEILIASYVIPWGITYNILAILFCIIGLNLNLKKEKIKNYSIYQGLIIFLIFLTKHNIGIYYLIGQIIINILTKEKIKNILIQTGITIIGISVFLTILCKERLLNSFINMAFLGVDSFIKNLTLNPNMILVTSGIIIFLGILIYKRKYDKANKNTIKILIINSIICLLLAFPIADSWHIILGSMSLYITLIYFLENNKISLNNTKALKLITGYLVLYMILNVSYIAYSVKIDDVKLITSKDSTFYLCPMKDYQKIDLVEKFIKEKENKVIIISPESGIYNIELGLESKGIFDLPFNGNIGKTSISDMTKKLEKYNDYYILIHTDKKYNQEIDELRKYIKSNYEEIEKIEDFSVYKNN